MNEPQMVWNKREYSHEKKSKKLLQSNLNKIADQNPSIILCFIAGKMKTYSG